MHPDLKSKSRLDIEIWESYGAQMDLEVFEDEKNGCDKIFSECFGGAIIKRRLTYKVKEGEMVCFSNG